MNDEELYRLKNELDDAIFDYLYERVESNAGGYAHVTQNDYTALCGVIDKLIELKYEADMYGALPVEAIVIRKEREFVIPPYRLPHSHKVSNITQMIEAITCATRVVSAASRYIDTLLNLFSLNRLEYNDAD